MVIPFAPAIMKHLFQNKRDENFTLSFLSSDDLVRYDGSESPNSVYTATESAKSVAFLNRYGFKNTTSLGAFAKEDALRGLNEDCDYLPYLKEVLDEYT